MKQPTSGGRTSRSERGPELRVGGCAQAQGLGVTEAYTILLTYPYLIECTQAVHGSD